MRKREQKGLEDIARRVRKSITLPELEPLHDFETKIKKIARKYGGNDTIHQEGSHRNIHIGGRRIIWSPRQKGHESVLSIDVFKDVVERISEVTGAPYELLELYFKGSGKLYKCYKRRFEKEYDL
jgi:hypothetical protein